MALGRKLNAATPLDYSAVAWDAEVADTSGGDHAVSDGKGFSALYVGGAGDVSVVTAGGNTVVFKAVPAGSILPIAGTKVTQTNTTATNIVALVQ